MRTGILHNGTGESDYEIRNIISLAEKLEKLGVNIKLENIGDPIAKGEQIPVWMKEIVSGVALENNSYSYSPSQGLMETRMFLADRNNRRGGSVIGPEDIIFFNGLGEAISKVYGFLHKNARVILPSPTYTAHSSSEAFHSGLSPISYPLDPLNQWYPDISALRRLIKDNPTVVAILLINPDNPTGFVYPEEILKEIIKIAKEFELFIIADEIYENLTYEDSNSLRLSEIIEDIPGIAMKGISKELPWPGSRCGWIEIYNRERDPAFNEYIKSILNAKMMEVCSTTLPQKTIPRILEHPEYSSYVIKRKQRYERFSSIACEILGSVPGIIVNHAKGAFYMSIVFKDNTFSQNRKLPIMDEKIRYLIEQLVSGKDMNGDKIFTYYMLAETGICVVPLSSFNTKLQGFRFTLLETDECAFIQMIKHLAEGISTYLNSESN